MWKAGSSIRVNRYALGVFVAAILTAGAAFIAVPYWTAALVMRAAGTTGWSGALARWTARPVSESLQQFPVRTGHVRVRIFRPAGAADRSVLLIAGVHRDGIDEPRLVSLARELAATGVIVFTPDIDDLMQYRLTPRVTDTIEDVAKVIVEAAEKGQSVGLIGVSFSGGLSIVAAGRPALRDRIAYVMSFGGHGSLPRVLHYLCTGIEPAGLPGSPPDVRPPHDYAVAVLLHQAAELAVPAAQVASLRESIETFLNASALNRTSRGDAARLFDAARAGGASLPEPSRTLMSQVNDRRVAELGRLIGPHLDRLGQDPSLSPERAPPPSAPVYLLHGADDNVIPAVESVLLHEHLRERTRTRLLLSRYLTHVDLAARPTLADTWNMVAFWKAALSE